MIVGDNQPPVTGQNPTWDDSTAGVALQFIYTPIVAAVARQFEWDFTRTTVALVNTGRTPIGPNNQEFFYPAECVQLWQLMPGEMLDPFNPLPLNWSVANVTINGTQYKVIQTNIANAKAVIDNNPNENIWDSLFRETVVRMLASYLALAIAGRLDVQQFMLESANGFSQLAQSRDS